jgi:hypothetical protein
VGGCRARGAGREPAISVGRLSDRTGAYAVLVDDDLKPSYGLKSAIIPISEVARRQNADALTAIHRSIINTRAISETFASYAAISSIIGQAAMPSKQIGAISAIVAEAAAQPSLTARAALAEALRPRVMVNAAIAEALAEALRPSQVMQESLAALSSQLAGLSAAAAQTSALASISQTVTASRSLGRLTADYTTYAEAAVIAEPALAEVDDEVAGAWIFAGWYSSLSQRKREFLLLSLIALMGPLPAIMNTFVSEQERVPDLTIHTYEAIAVVFAAACALRDTDEE